MDAITALHGSEDDLLDLAAIEREVAAMWRSATTEHPGVAVTRACRTNLVVLADGEAPEWIGEVTVRHPARLIVVARARSTNGATPSPICARVSALCHMRPGEGHGLVCSERIALSVREGEEARVPSVVRGLAVGELPVVVFGEAGALERYAASGLFEVADRVLVDSTGAEPSLWMRLTDAPDSPGRAFAQASVLGAPGRRGGMPPPRLFDLAWLRLAEYCRVIAASIERSPMGKAVHRLESVDIAHARRPTSALLLAGWLSYRLHWGWPRRLEPRGTERDAGTVAGDPGGLHVLELPARGRRVRLRFGRASATESLVVLLRGREAELRVALGAAESTATIARGAGPHTVRRSARPANGPRPRPRPEQVEIPPPHPASLVIQGLEHAGLCNRDALPVLARARALAAALDHGAADW